VPTGNYQVRRCAGASGDTWREGWRAWRAAVAALEGPFIDAKRDSLRFYILHFTFYIIHFNRFF